MNENQNEYVDINAHDNYPDSEQKIEIPTMKVIPLKKICMTIGQLPTAYLETMSYYEMLVWFIEFLKNNIIPTINNNASAIQEVQSVVLALQNYINNYKDSIDSDVEELEEYMNNYFENLDVQEEINNKLDQMLEDGVLEQIIEQFIQSTAIWCFDNVADMKLATNLINESYTRTLGYHTINDGGMATYKIRTKTNDDVVNEMNIIALHDNSLIAELVLNDYVSVKQLGAKGDNLVDDTSVLQYAISNYNNIIIPSGIYKITNSLIAENNTRYYQEDGYLGKKISGCENTKIVIYSNAPAIIVRGYHNLLENLALTFDDTIYDTFTASLLELQSLNSNTIKQCCNNTFNNIRCITSTNVYSLPDKFSGIGINITSDGNNATYQNKFKNCNIADLYKGLVINNASSQGINANYFNIDLWNCNYLLDENGSGNIFNGNYQASKKLSNENNFCFTIKGNQNVLSGYIWDTGEYNNDNSHPPYLNVTGINNIFTMPIILKNAIGKISANHFSTFTTPDYNDTEIAKNCRVASTKNYEVPLSIAPYQNSLQNSLVSNFTLTYQNITAYNIDAVYTEKDSNGIPTNYRPLVSNIYNKRMEFGIQDNAQLKLRFTMFSASILDSLYIYLTNRRYLPDSIIIRLYKTSFESSDYLVKNVDMSLYTQLRTECISVPLPFKTLQSYNYVEIEFNWATGGTGKEFGLSYLSGVIINDIYGPLLDNSSQS